MATGYWNGRQRITKAAIFHLLHPVMAEMAEANVPYTASYIPRRFNQLADYLAGVGAAANTSPATTTLESLADIDIRVECLQNAEAFLRGTLRPMPQIQHTDVLSTIWMLLWEPYRRPILSLPLDIPYRTLRTPADPDLRPAFRRICTEAPTHTEYHFVHPTPSRGYENKIGLTNMHKALRHTLLQSTHYNIDCTLCHFFYPPAFLPSPH